MKSKIMIEFDFDKLEPFIQIYKGETANQLPVVDKGIEDIRDKILNNFLELSNERGLELIYKEDNDRPQIRIKKN